MPDTWLMLVTPRVASCSAVAGRLLHEPSAFAANRTVVLSGTVGSVAFGFGPQLSSSRLQPLERSGAAGTDVTRIVRVRPSDSDRVVLTGVVRDRRDVAGPGVERVRLPGAAQRHRRVDLLRHRVA